MNKQQVRNYDKNAIEKLGIPGIVLMENAGKGATDIIAKKLIAIKGKSACIICGKGNNGGDGFVIARHLKIMSYNVKIIILAEPTTIKGDAKINYDITQKMNIETIALPPQDSSTKSEISAHSQNCDIIIDAIFGTGFQGQLTDQYQTIITAINNAKKPIIAIDIPTGLDCDTGKPLPIAIVATDTVTFVAIKDGFLNQKAKQITGTVHVVSIGI